MRIISRVVGRNGDLGDTGLEDLEDACVVAGVVESDSVAGGMLINLLRRKQ